ncbi:rRNA maturation RNase YbeY [Streptococcus penaeicida]|uniref:rRNA maturation RNase YbeY n=1 Tax=Streptococcus penaeicida TaxID=1765960 RepID=UPI001FE464B4|nr:rRNA maturation RNase YbeY [Streptococcus penaeicida]
MYIEMIDETGLVSQEIMEQTKDLLDFAAKKTGKEEKEMSVTFVTNERSHELNLEYRNTDRPTDVISLEYKPEKPILFEKSELAENPELAEMLAEFDAILENFSSQSIKLENKLQNMVILLKEKWAF